MRFGTFQENFGKCQTLTTSITSTERLGSVSTFHTRRKPRWEHFSKEAKFRIFFLQKLTKYKNDQVESKNFVTTEYVFYAFHIIPYPEINFIRRRFFQREFLSAWTLSFLAQTFSRPWARCCERPSEAHSWSTGAGTGPWEVRGERPGPRPEVDASESSVAPEASETEREC